VTPALRWRFAAAEAPSRLREAGDALDEVLASRGVSDRSRFAARLVAEEVVLNAIEHGGARSVSMEAELEDGRIGLVFEDDGAPFDPTPYRAEAAAGAPEDARPRGRGLILVRGFTRGVEYRRVEGRNRVSLELVG
jgi:anti-sigma regulatory factor (Ser/Thr protein kinase)